MCVCVCSLFGRYWLRRGCDCLFVPHSCSINWDLNRVKCGDSLGNMIIGMFLGRELLHLELFLPLLSLSSLVFEHLDVTH